MKKLFLLVMIVFAFTITSCKQETTSTKSSTQKEEVSSQDYDSAVKELLKAMNYQQNLETMLKASFAQMGSENQALIDELKEKMPNVMTGIYKNHFTINEIKELTALNNDSIYKKMMKMQTQVNQELMAEGQAFVLGKPSPNANVTVSSEFKDAMAKYLEAEEFTKQMEQLKPLFAQNYQNAGVDKALDDLYEKMPDMMTTIFSKYYTVDDIKHLTELSNKPISKKFRQETPAITQEAMNKSQKLIEEFFNKQGN